MASRVAKSTPLETIPRFGTNFEDQLEAFKAKNQEVSKLFNASAALSDIKPKNTPGFLAQYNTYLRYLDELISHFNKNQEIAKKNQRNERLEIDCTPFLIFEYSLTRLFGMFLDRAPRYDTELIALSKLLTPLRGLVTIIKEKKNKEINLIRFKDIEEIEMELYLCTKKKTDALVKYNVEMTKSATNALCNYEESNLGLTEKLRSKEKLRVQKYEDQLIYYGAPTSYWELISRYEKKSNKKFPPSQQLIYLPPIRRESPALRTLPLSDDAACSNSPVLKIPRIRAPDTRASAPILPPGRHTQTPPRSPVHARILSKSRSSRRIGPSGVAAPATNADPTKTPTAENQPRALPSLQQTQTIAPDEPNHFDSLRESQQSEAQSASETNQNEPIRKASNYPAEDMKEQLETAIDNEIDKTINSKEIDAIESLKNLGRDRMPMSNADANKTPEESVSDKGKDTVIDKDIYKESVDNDDVEAENDIKEEDAEVSSAAGTPGVQNQVADEVKSPGKTDMVSAASSNPPVYRRFPVYPQRIRKHTPSPSPSVSPPPEATEAPKVDELKNSESLLEEEKSKSPSTSDENNCGDSDSATGVRPLDDVKADDVDIISEASSSSPDRSRSYRKSTASPSSSSLSKAVELKSSESQLGDDELDEGNPGNSVSKEVRLVDEVKVVDVEPRRDEFSVQQEAEAVQENQDENSQGAASSNHENNDDGESQKAPDSPERQVPVVPAHADANSEDDKIAGRADSSDSEVDEEPPTQPASSEDPASLDVENSEDDCEAREVFDVQKSPSSESSADDSEEPGTVEEPDSPEERPVQVPEDVPREKQESSEDNIADEQVSDQRESNESAKESREKQSEKTSRGKQESLGDDTADGSEQASDNRVLSESDEEPKKEKPEEVPTEFKEEKKTGDDSSSGKSQGSPESPVSPEEPSLEDKPVLKPIDTPEEYSESSMCPESKLEEHSVSNQEDSQAVTEAVLHIDAQRKESCGIPHKRSAEPVESEESPQKRRKLDDSPRRRPEQPPME